MRVAVLPSRGFVVAFFSLDFFFFRSAVVAVLTAKLRGSRRGRRELIRRKGLFVITSF
jgi:hypothetical protein